tara:strand:- start:409 stop:993 length:585 start_codon:yes stop_codon:yes gene_type:complete
MKKKIQPAVLGASGEYLVLSKLLLQGFVAGKAPDNTADYDLLASTKDGKNLSPIQVKTTRTTNQWRMSEKHEKIIPKLIYCFVNLKTEDRPCFYVIDSKTVSTILIRSHKIWKKYPRIDGQKKEDKKNSMRVILKDYNKLSGLSSISKELSKKNETLSKYLSQSDLNFLSEYSEGWIDKYENNWGKLNSHLKCN